MPKSELGYLRTVEIAQAWENEPRDFTPWLAENLDRLSDAIGVRLSDPQTEVRSDQQGVDRFCADIVATTATGETALIENQFTGSDHGHLGQIMTYLAGVEAKMIIWIAPSFRPSHLSAIRWLNTHTTDDFSFFAVALRVVQIGTSALAPLFDVVERPNNWERQLQEKQRVISAPQVSENRRFWDHYVALCPVAAKDAGGGGRGSTRWRVVPDSDLVIARWVARGVAGLFVRGGRSMGTEPFDRLPALLKQRLADDLGGNFDDERYPLLKYWDRDVEGEKDWPEVIRWLEAETEKYVAAVSAALVEVEK